MEIWGGNTAIDDAVSAPGMDAWFYSRPYKDDNVGGDVHYASMCAAGRIARFVVADVAGHGQEVDEFAQSLRKLMRKHINTPDQTNFTRAMNKELLTVETHGKFATALLVTYFEPSNQLIVCNAGHPLPLWYRADEDSWTFLHHKQDGAINSGKVQNLPLGIIEPTSYYQFAVQPSVGDLFLIVTDGFDEAKSPDGNMLSEKGFLEMVRSIDCKDPTRFLPLLLEKHQQFRGGKPADDDLTAVLLHHNGAPPRQVSVGERISAIAKMLGLAKV